MLQLEQCPQFLHKPLGIKLVRAYGALAFETHRWQSF